MSTFQRVKDILDKLKNENIKFRRHFSDRVKERPISEEMVKKYLKETDRLTEVEDQSSGEEGVEKYKLWIKLSNRYSLVLIVAIHEKDLYIITGWNTDRKWQKSMQR